MTRTELNNSISLILNNAVADGSVTPEMEANAIKLVADYVDELTVQKVKKVSLTSSEILNLFTTPKELVAAIPGKIIQPINVIFKYNFNSVAYSGGNWRLNINNNLFTVASNINLAYNNVQSQAVVNTFTDDTTNIVGNSLKLSMNANPTLGNGTVDVYVTYFEITV